MITLLQFILRRNVTSEPNFIHSSNVSLTMVLEERSSKVEIHHLESRNIYNIF